MAGSLPQASKRAQQQALVDSLDSLGEDQVNFELVHGNNNPIEEAVADFITRVKENIQNEDMIVTGKIEDIKMKVEGNRILVLANPHLIYQSRGVNGSLVKRYDTPHAYTDKMPPVDVFVDYIRTKNIQLRNSENLNGKLSPFEDIHGDDKAIMKAAWGMARNVFLRGFKPRKIYSKEIPQLVDEVKKVAPQFAIQQIKQLINVKDSAKRIIIKK